MGCVFMATFVLEDGASLMVTKHCNSETDAFTLCLRWQSIKNGEIEAPSFKKQTVIEYIFSTIRDN